MTPKWESPEIAYYDGFGRGRDLGHDETTAKMELQIIIIAIVMFVGGLSIGIWLW